jgi:TRAP transporter TAXI family solute receptor
MVQLVTRALALAFLLVLAACARGPDGPAVKEAIQKQLDDALGGRVLAVERLTRAGGAPLKDRAGRLVYFNAELKLARDYNFTNWDAHSVASLANLLGAGPKGVLGLSPDGNKAGNTLGVYGTAAFAESGGRYTLLPSVPPDVETGGEIPAAAVVASVRQPVREAPPPTPAQAALARLSELFAARTSRELPASEREAILEDEFRQAYARARARLDHAAQVVVVAGGPEGGAYAEMLRALELRAQSAGVLLDPLSSEGSLGNIRLLNLGSAQFALVQNDIAQSAHGGRGRFSGAPQPNLRAVASLFPEPIHLIARADSKIASVADLRGKRVDLGLEGSGTRANALAILAVSGIAESALAAAGASSLPDAASALAEGRIDAFFATIHAPAREIARLASRTPVAVVPIGPSRELIDTGLVPLTLPALTYAGQRAPVPTVAATALLVTREDVAPPTVAALMRLLFEERGGALTAAVSQVRVQNARNGVNLPFHPQADAYLKANAVPAKPAASR